MMVLKVALAAAFLLISETTSRGSDFQGSDAVGKKSDIDWSVERDSWELSDQDFLTIKWANKADATSTQKLNAADVCSKKCKVCYNGSTCDYDCAKKNCSKK